jgi:membrane protein YqaA with SNARE-associated domain
VTRRADDGRPFDRLERLARGRAGIAALAAWGFGEALVLPIVPDVLLYILAAAAPRRALVLFASVIVGGLAGTLALYGLAVAAPETAEWLVLSVPGIDRAMLEAARHLVASGDPLALAAFGPGTPLKVDTIAWSAGSGTWLGLLVGVVLNRLTRIGPGLLVAAVLGWRAPAWIRRHDRALVVAYVVGWVILYAVYLS